jgi:glycine hydroxymethyltransferase
VVEHTLGKGEVESSILFYGTRMKMEYTMQALKKQDVELAAAIQAEYERQQNQIELIASENITSHAVLEAQGSVLTNKYAEGYPGRRYYNGCEHVDTVEKLAIERVCKLFNSQFANVQPHSGAQANLSVFFALLNPGDTFMGMSLNSGGHLTHGAKVTISGKWFNAVSYDVDPTTMLIDYDAVEKLAVTHKPKLIIAGGSAYPREIDFKRFREIADKAGAYLMVDMAHFAGLVAGGVFPSPLPYADVVTSTTHKTLRGPRGGIILSNDENIAKKINSAVFPGIQGGPLMHVIAGKAAAFQEALEPGFKDYVKQVVLNAKALGQALMENGLDLISGGTDCHLMLVDLRAIGVSGADLCNALEAAYMASNKNSIPFDTTSPSVTSGIRIGTPSGTTRGFKEEEFKQIGKWICEIANGLKNDDLSCIDKIKESVSELCQKFPIYK